MAQPLSELGRASPVRPAQIPATPVTPAQPNSPPPSRSHPSPSHTSQVQAGRVPSAQPDPAVSCQSSVGNNSRRPSRAGLSMRTRPTVAMSAPFDESEDAEPVPHVPLWDKACTHLRAAKSKYLQALEDNLGDVNSDGSLGDRILQLEKEHQAKIRSKDVVSQTSWRRWLGRTARAALSIEDVAMGLARLDKHGVAPIVLGGVFTVMKLIHGVTDESRAAMAMALELGYIVSLWNTVEKRQILSNQDPTLAKSYGKLSDAIVRMYENIVVLLGTMVAYFNKSKLRRIIGEIAPAYLEWENIQTEIKSLETNCTNIKSQITHVKEAQEMNSEILKCISSYDIRGVYKKVLEDTGINEIYSTRCQWIIEHGDFKKWYNPGESSVLWLKGTIGTGKTTLMARAIREMQESEMIDADAKPLAIFFFQKALDHSTPLLDFETCLRSLVRQLSWNCTTSEVQPLVKQFYGDLHNQQNHGSTMTAGECVELLTDLISDTETYIMIDALDECQDSNRLLEKLKELTLRLKEGAKEREPLHLMLCSRDDLPVTECFRGCLTITTSTSASEVDQTFYITTEIDRMNRLKPGSLFFSSEQRYPDRLKKILMEKSGGLFRWTRIQIEKFTKRYRYAGEIEDELKWLESHTTHPELNEEYARLLHSLNSRGESKRTRKCAIKMLKLILCCWEKLTVEALAEAITPSEHETNRVQLTADDVRRILVGFITEDELSEPAMYYRPNPANTLFVRLAHSSVVEYLADDELNDEDFSSLALHSEAAGLCFASLSQGQHGDAQTFSDPKLPDPIIMPLGTEFFGYSCKYWPFHCRSAFAENGTCDLVRNTSRFILSQAYSTWNRVICESYVKLWPCRFMHSTRTNHTDARPGFAIAFFGLTALLELPEMRSIVDLQEVNGTGTRLLTSFLEESTDISVIERLVDLYPEQIKWNRGDGTLWRAAVHGVVELVRRLLDSGGDVSECDWDGLTALHHAVQRLRTSSRQSTAPLNRYALIIELLLRKGANIYDADKMGRTPMHFAKSRNEQELLIRHAKRLEKRGLIGGVQALLRMRDYNGATPSQFISPDIYAHDTQYLREQLKEATDHDGKVMYDFTDPNNIVALQAGVFNMQADKKAVARYKEWHQKRRQELEDAYKAVIQKTTT